MENPLTPTAPTGEPIMLWSAQSVPVHQRSQRWYAIGGAVVLGTAVYGIVTGSWIFAIVVLLSGALYVILRNAKPRSHTIAFFPQGFTYDGAFTRWEEMAGFWFLAPGPYTELRLSWKDPRRADVVIHLGPHSMEEVRAALSHYLSELTDKRERVLDTIIRICKL